LLHS